MFEGRQPVVGYVKSVLLRQRATGAHHGRRSVLLPAHRESSVSAFSEMLLRGLFRRITVKIVRPATGDRNLTALRTPYSSATQCCGSEATALADRKRHKIHFVLEP